MLPASLHTLVEIALRTGVIYLLVLIGIRISGKREVGQMTPFDLTLLLLISNSVQNAMTGPDTSLAGGAVAAGTLLIMNYRRRSFPEAIAGSGSSSRGSRVCWCTMARSSKRTWQRARQHG